MSLNWTRADVATVGVSGVAGFEAPASYVISVPDASGIGTIILSDRNLAGVQDGTVPDPQGLRRANNNNNVEFYIMNYVFEAIPDANGEASFVCDGGGGISFLMAQKVQTVSGQKFTVSGSKVVQSAEDGGLFTVRSLHSSGCDYSVQRWGVDVCKISNKLV